MIYVAIVANEEGLEWGEISDVIGASTSNSPEWIQKMKNIIHRRITRYCKKYPDLAATYSMDGDLVWKPSRGNFKLVAGKQVVSVLVIRAFK